MIKKYLYTLSLLLILPVTVLSQETLPPYHWANTYLDYLIVNGSLSQLNRNQRPFNRGEIARALLQIENIDQSTANDRKILKEMFAEFSAEFDLLARQEGEKWQVLIEKVKNFLEETEGKTESKMTLKAGGYLRGGAVRLNESNDGYFKMNPLVVFYFTPDLIACWNFVVFNKADKDYIGKKFSGLYAYNEQAYLEYNNDWLKVKFGRDWLQLGPGSTGQLLFSDNSRTFDQYYFQIGKSSLQLHFWGIMLDRRRNPEPALREKNDFSNRFINGHRLSYNYKNRYRFALNEIVLYGGPDVQWELPYMNPLTSYHAYMLNRNYRDGNVFYSAEWDLYFKNVEVYGEFLVDDIQIEEKTALDLEPDQWGLIAGVKWSNLFKWNGSLFNTEYIHLRHRAYNSPNYDWEKYLHRNKVIGYALESNLERYYVKIDKWWAGNLKSGVFLSYLRKGEGNTAGAYNKDFLEREPGEDYSEPFPFGIVEKHLQAGISFFYRPLKYGNIQLEAAYNDFGNYLNIKGKNHSEWTARAELWLEWKEMLRLD
ncbi:MAG: hypothetical protein JXR46_00525 [Calditrichaceae bacterium]|nr:hypothetical protein [Calditrichaceae bacterium]MBN2707498.1 hypothetical protein [Calditrichaceae bacterium]RQV95589.1 MAG: hypothetical protein EH224_06930 [Calditrichota bacterium]